MHIITTNFFLHFIFTCVILASVPEKYTNQEFPMNIMHDLKHLTMVRSLSPNTATVFLTLKYAKEHNPPAEDFKFHPTPKYLFVQTTGSRVQKYLKISDYWYLKNMARLTQEGLIHRIIRDKRYVTIVIPNDINEKLNITEIDQYIADNPAFNKEFKITTF